LEGKRTKREHQPAKPPAKRQKKDRSEAV